MFFIKLLNWEDLDFPLGVEIYKVKMTIKSRDGQLYGEHTRWNLTTPRKLRRL
jgi:hypothetical protein